MGSPLHRGGTTCGCSSLEVRVFPALAWSAQGHLDLWDSWLGWLFLPLGEPLLELSGGGSWAWGSASFCSLYTNLNAVGEYLGENLRTCRNLGRLMIKRPVILLISVLSLTLTESHTVLGCHGNRPSVPQPGPFQCLL